MKAVHEGGGLGFIAAGYKSSEAMTAEIAATRELNIPFGMNVFVPDPSQLPPGPEARAELEAYRAELEPEAARYGVTLPPLRLDDDDAWQDKIDALLADPPVEFVSFAFGLPGKPVVQALQKAGTRVISSVTSVDEALAAAEEGPPDAIAVQHSSAGGHTAAFLPGPQGPAARTTAELVAQVRAAVGLPPLIAAGAIMNTAVLRDVLAAGAVAAQVGTAWFGLKRAVHGNRTRTRWVTLPSRGGQQ